MQSATSSSKRNAWFYPTLWKKNMTRFWPIWAVYGACWAIAMPLMLLTELRGDGYGSMPPGSYFAVDVVRGYASWGSLLAASTFGILSAMAVFSYLYNNRSAGMMHALPVRREGMFLTNYLSGLSFMLLPTLAVFVLTLLAELLVGYVDAGALGIWLLSQVLQTLFFYSFAVFCAMFTGHILALPAFYGILNGLAAGLYFLIHAVLEQFVFGYSGGGAMEEGALWLSPIAKLGSELRVNVEWSETGEFVNAQFVGMGYAFLYAAVGVVLAALALVFYRKRHLEGAGDVVTVRWVRPIFKYGVAFCTALALGSLLYSIFVNASPEGAWGFLLFLIPCGAVGYFAAQMLLRKSFRIFGESWKGCIVFSLCLVALTAALELDLTGFERRVPDPAQVASVRMSGPFTTPSDSARHYELDTEESELVETVVRLHAAVVAEQEACQRAKNNWVGSYEEGTVDGMEVGSIQTEETVDVRLTYTMINGSKVERRYFIPVSASDLDDPATPGGILAGLVNRSEDKVRMYFAKELDDMRLLDVSISSEEGNDEEGRYQRFVSIAQGHQEELLAAVKADLAAGRIGIRYLMDDADRLSNCYWNDLQFNFQKETVTASGRTESATAEVTITLQKTATETLALLKELGVDEQVELMTQAERQHESWKDRLAEPVTQERAVQ